MKEKISKPFVFLSIIILVSIIGLYYFYNSFIGEISRVVLLSSSLFLVFGIQTKSESKSLLEFKKESYDSLHTWLNDLKGGHLLINELLSDIEVKDNLLTNLKNVKNKILIYSNHDINNLHLLKAYFTVIKEEKEKETYFKVIMSFLVGIILFFIRSPQVISTNTFLSKLLVFFSFGVTHFCNYFFSIFY